MPGRLRVSQSRKYSWRKHRHIKEASYVVSLPIHCAPLSALHRQFKSYGQLSHGILECYLSQRYFNIGWVMSTASPCRSQSIQLCQLQQVDADKPPAVHFSILIRADHSWTSFLCGQQVIAVFGRYSVLMLLHVHSFPPCNTFQLCLIMYTLSQVSFVS